MSALPPLATVAQIKEALRMIPTDASGNANVTKTDDGLLNLLANAASNRFERECGRPIAKQTITERLDGTGTRKIILSAYPILAVASLAIVTPASSTGGAAQSVALVYNTDFVYTSMALVHLSSYFVPGSMNVQVTYTAGYDPIPSDITVAVAKWCAVRYRELAHVGEKSRSMGGSTTYFDTSDLPPDVAGCVASWRTTMPRPSTFVQQFR